MFAYNEVDFSQNWEYVYFAKNFSSSMNRKLDEAWEIRVHEGKKMYLVH